MTVAVLDLITLPPFLFENGDLITTGMAKDFSFNGHSIHGRASHLDLAVVIIGQEDLIEGHFFTFLGIELVHDDPLILLDLVLVACDLYDSVHERSST